MAITGRFEADFQSFYQAVDRANAKLTDFQSGAGRVETSLNKMVDNFSGRRLIQEVTLSTEAVSRLEGGIHSLTDRELQALASKATEAVAKMKAMGIEVPPQIQKVAGELRHTSEETGFLGKSFEDIGSKVIAAFAIERVVEFVLEVGKAQQQLQRLGKETQIDVEELQTLTAATASYGLTNEELGRSLFNLSQRISGGDASVARGLHQIGLSLDDVKNKHGKDLFLEVESGLAKLQGQLRDTASADIWGSKLGASLGGFAKEAVEAVDKADKLNTKLSRESVAAMAEYADSIERAERNLGTLRDSMLGPLAQGINVINDANQKGIGFWRSIGLATKDALFYLPGLTSGGHSLADALDKVNRANVEGAASTKGATEQHKQSEVAITAETQAVRFLMALRRDAAKELTPLQRLALADLREMGALTSDNAAAIGVGVDQFKNYVEQVRQADAATKVLTATTAEQSDQVRKLSAEVAETMTKRTGTQTEIELAELQKREDAEIASVEKRSAAAKASLEQQHADSKENLDKIAADAAAATTKIQSSFDQLRDGVGVDFDEIRTHSQAALNDAADRALKTLIEAQSTIGDLARRARQADGQLPEGCVRCDRDGTAERVDVREIDGRDFGHEQSAGRSTRAVAENARGRAVQRRIGRSHGGEFRPDLCAAGSE
jgi:hypothetical protein